MTERQNLGPAPAGVDVRPAGAEHRAALVALMGVLQDCERELSPDRPSGSTMAAGHVDYLLRLVREQSGGAWVALIDDRVVGFAIAVVEREDEGDLHLFPEFRARGLVTDLVVDPAWRRRGIARSLLQAAEAHCRALGLACIRVAALRGNEGARACYRANDYREYELLFEKALDPL